MTAPEAPAVDTDTDVGPCDTAMLCELPGVTRPPLPPLLAATAVALTYDDVKTPKGAGNEKDAEDEDEAAADGVVGGDAATASCRRRSPSPNST